MNYIIHIKTVNSIFQSEDKFKSGHISLYMALFTKWNSLKFKNSFTMSRKELKLKGKIGSNSTYYKYLADLRQRGLIHTKEDKKQHVATTFILVPFDTKMNQIKSENESMIDTKVDTLKKPISFKQKHFPFRKLENNNNKDYAKPL